jgi:glycosyltransferase involved in cell wall biosynthesis
MPAWETSNGMSPPVSLKACIVITTKDRKEELRRCLASCMTQQPPVDVLVLDDGSRDGTGAMVEREFPTVRLIRSEVSRGVIAQRNRGAQLADGDVVISLDDDAVISTPDLVRATLAQMGDPRVGAVAIPIREFRGGALWDVGVRAPDAERIYVCREYVGCAHAVRRDVFLRLGGYFRFLRFGYEELGLSMLLLESGFAVRVGTSAPILHYPSLQRDVAGQKREFARSAVLVAWRVVPWSRLPLHLLGVAYHIVQHGVQNGFFMSRLRGLAAGMACCVREPVARAPVSRATYRVIREMTRCGAMPLELVAQRLGWKEGA